MEERLQKIMSHSGMGSRRSCEAMIEAGRVTVNGQLAILGQKADPARDRILVDGQLLKSPEALVYIALYKPRGVLATLETDDPRKTVRDLVEVPGHLYPVGRLDFDSEGLILLTNDGELANRLTHPRYGHEKEYRVLVSRRPDEEQLNIWQRGVVLEDGYRTAPAKVYTEGTLGKGAWLRVVLREGRKRQIREMGLRTGLPVVKIIRVRIGSLTLGGLNPRQWRYLSPEEIISLKVGSVRAAGKPSGKTAAKSTGRPAGNSAEKPTGKKTYKQSGNLDSKSTNKQDWKLTNLTATKQTGKPRGKPLSKSIPKKTSQKLGKPSGSTARRSYSKTNKKPKPI